MGKYLNWRDKQLVSPDKQLSQEQLDPPEDGNPFEADWHQATLAGYEATIKRGDGLVEWGYVSILLFLGMDERELVQWRTSLISTLTKHMRTKFETSQQAHLSRVEQLEKIKADKQNRKRNKIEQTTFDPLASNVSGEMQAKKKPAKKLNKPKSGAKGSTRRYANEVAKANTESMFE